MSDKQNNTLERNVKTTSPEQVDSKDVCYSPEDILTELKSGEHQTGFMNEVPFSQGPYLDAPFSQFPNFLNGPLP